MCKTPSGENHNEDQEKVNTSRRELSEIDRKVIETFCLTKAGVEFFAKMYANKDFEALFAWTLQVMGCYLDLQKRFEAESYEQASESMGKKCGKA